MNPIYSRDETARIGRIVQTFADDFASRKEAAVSARRFADICTAANDSQGVAEMLSVAAILEL